MKAREIAPIIKMSITSAARDSKTVKEMILFSSEFLKSIHTFDLTSIRFDSIVKC